eukprot:585978-Pyramimonas_sp.AAC.1
MLDAVVPHPMQERRWKLCVHARAGLGTGCIEMCACQTNPYIEHAAKVPDDAFASQWPRRYGTAASTCRDDPQWPQLRRMPSWPSH